MKAHSDDVVTLASVGVLCFVGCDLGHELLGHGGACLATGGRAASFSTVHFQCFGGWQPLITASGILFNIVAGTIAYALLRPFRSSGIHARYFIWLFAFFNLLTGWYYIVQSSLTGTGDWANFLRLIRASSWRIGTALIAAVMLVLSGLALALELRFFIGSTELNRTWRLATIPFWTLAWLPSAVRLIYSTWNAGQFTGVVGQVAYSAGFLAIPLIFRFSMTRALPYTAVARVSREVRWILLGSTALVVFVFVFGPGITLIRK